MKNAIEVLTLLWVLMIMGTAILAIVASIIYAFGGC